MSIENKHIDLLDSRIPGVVSLGIHEGFRACHEFVNMPIIQTLKRNDFMGNLRGACVERYVQEHLLRSNINLSITEESVSPNGFSYNIYKVDNGEFTIHKVGSQFALPRYAENRQRKLRINKNIELLDSNNMPLDEEKMEYNDSITPYFFVTYGGKNYELKFARIGLANQDCESWIEAESILNAMSIATISTNDKKEIEISIKKEIEEKLGESINDGENSQFAH